MNLENVIHVFIALVVLLQAPGNVDLIMQLQSKISRVEGDLKGDFSPLSIFSIFRRPPPVLMYGRCYLCPWGTCRPVIKPPSEPFDPEADVEELHDALTRTRVVVKKRDLAEIMIESTELERNMIAASFKAKYSIELWDKIQDRLEIGSRYQKLMRVLATPLPLFLAKQFRYAMDIQQIPDQREQGRINIVEMLTSLPRCLIVSVIEAYNSLGDSFGDFFTRLSESLEIGEMTREYIYTVESLVKVERESTIVITEWASWISAFMDAFKLKNAVDFKRVKEIKSGFLKLFTKRSFSHIIKTMKVYDYLKGTGSMIKDISYREFGKIEEIYKLMIQILTNKPLYFATKMEKILKDKHLKDGDVEFIVLLRSRLNIDLQDIIDFYNVLSKTGLVKDFESWDGSTLSQSFHDAVIWIIA